MKVTVYTLYLNDYLGEVARHTLASIRSWSERMGARFELIKTREYPEWPITYEKVQIHRRSLLNGDDWSVHVDADMLLHPALGDLIAPLDPRAVAFHVAYDPSLWFDVDEYFFRDGRKLGLTSNFVAASKFCRDLWTPFEIPFEEAARKVRRLHGIDDYRFSQNLARFGLGAQGLLPEPESQFMVKHLGAGGIAAGQSMLDEVKETLRVWDT